MQYRAPETVPIGPEAFEERDNTAVIWLGGGGFLLGARGTVLLIDPVLMMKSARVCETGLELLIDYPIDARDVPGADAVLYTHTDDDHLAPRTAQALGRVCGRFIGTGRVGRALAALGIPDGKIHVGMPGDTFYVDGVEIGVTPADHLWQLSDPKKFGTDFTGSDCCGFRVSTPDGVFLFPGDTRLMPEHLLAEGVDVLAMDASRDAYHLGTQNSAKLANHHAGALLIPYHYGTYDQPEHTAHNGDPREVIELVRGAESRVRLLAPGQPLYLRDGREVTQ